MRVISPNLEHGPDGCELRVGFARVVVLDRKKRDFEKIIRNDGY